MAALGAVEVRQIEFQLLRCVALGIARDEDHVQFVGVPSRCWWVDVTEADKDAELSFLRQEIYGGEIDLLARRIDAYDRFSERS